MKDLGNLNNWTKVDLARVITQALFNSDSPLPANHFQVTRLARRSKAHLIVQAERAIEIISHQ